MGNTALQMGYIKRTLFAAAALAFLPALAMAQNKVTADPALPQYGQEVTLELNSQWLIYLPALRYSVDGYTINVDYEYLVQDFGGRPDFATNPPINVGELAPGNYTVRARFYDIENPGNVSSTESSIAVVPPGSWGIYSLPAQPQAFTANKAIIKSAAYFYPNTMRTTVTGNTVRVDFDYVTSSTFASTSDAPAGAQAYGSVTVPPLAPGVYTLEGWGRTNGGAYEKFFSTQVTVVPTTEVVEYYSATLDHFFMTIGANEIAIVDRGTQGDWKRTGQKFGAWTRQVDAPPAAKPVCRFYSSGANSHFFTASAQECDSLKAGEQQGRAQAAASGQQFRGWAYEGITFWALVPDANGACAANTIPVKRYYNNRAAEGDPNHRFASDPTQQWAMTAESIEEGVAFCSAP